MIFAYICLIVSNDKIDLNVYLNNEGNVNLNWGLDTSDQNYFYIVYRSSDDEKNWEPISSYDYKTTQTLKVLNVYPIGTHEYPIPDVNFRFNDGTSITTKLSAILKLWIEGGSFELDSHTYKYDPIGFNSETNQQAIHVTLISSLEFESFSLDKMKEYDIIVFGIWNTYGGEVPYLQTIEKTTKYLELGYGVLLTHGLIGIHQRETKESGFSIIYDRFGIMPGILPKDIKVSGSFLDGSDLWVNFYGKNVKAQRSLFTDYPNTLDMSEMSFDIQLTHGLQNIAFGDVWAELNNESSIEKNHEKYENIKKINWEIPGKGLRTGNPLFYLTTLNNTAVINLGYSNFKAELNEIKILTNTLYYLYQRTNEQKSLDKSLIYKTQPQTPSASKSDNDLIKLNIENHAKSFYYKVIGTTNNGIKISSKNVKLDVDINVEKYLYIINDSPIGTEIYSETQENVQQTKEGLIKDLKKGEYIHVATVNQYGIISKTISYKISDLSFEDQPKETEEKEEPEVQSSTNTDIKEQTSESTKKDKSQKDDDKNNEETNLPLILGIVLGIFAIIIITSGIIYVVIRKRNAVVNAEEISSI